MQDATVVKEVFEHGKQFVYEVKLEYMDSGALFYRQRICVCREQGGSEGFSRFLEERSPGIQQYVGVHQDTVCVAELVIVQKILDFLDLFFNSHNTNRCQYDRVSLMLI